MKRAAAFVLIAALPSAALGAKDAGAPERVKRAAGGADAGAADARTTDARAADARAADAIVADAGALDGSAPDAGRWHTCVEHLPSGAERPEVTDVLAPAALSGYAATLRVKVLHGKGERVFPNGIHIESSAQALEELKTAGFAIPDQDGGGAARLAYTDQDPAHPERASTTIDLPVLVLPPKPGRNHLTLPPLPIAIARAGGEVTTVCTSEHALVVEDPIAAETDPRPHDNPPPRPQREEWTAMREGLKWTAIGVTIGALAFAAWRWWSRRPKPEPPPPPPRPAWEVAMEKLAAIRTSKLLERNELAEYFDRVNDVVREYLGARFGFDGLESTSDEILASLRKAEAFAVPIAEVTLFLQECDLVKFAKLTPTLEQCKSTLEQGERLVRLTMPRVISTPAAPSAGGAS